ncbi:MAG: ThuA domain-containing protein [Planctomycetes bacterium]|nr:ThuA domain-containing protein [Planctomycetota bacterium]MCB9902918.1 ThuA domain-containing protein [Planctomycetota bacterium]
MRCSLLLAGLLLTACAASPAEDPPQERWIRYVDNAGPGRGKHVVLIAGEEEYRSEEALPILAHLLAKRHGFDTTVLFAQDAVTGEVDPTERRTIVGLEWLDQADLVVVFTRFREWDADEMQHFDAYLRRGKPVIGIRTATHAFEAVREPNGPYSHYAWDSRRPPGGFGTTVLGTTWVAHHGKHGEQSTRGVPVEEARDNPVLRGVGTIWCPTDVYAIEPLPADAEVLVRGKVLDGMTPDSPPAQGERFAEDVPIAWTREFRLRTGATMRVFTTTMGSARDFRDEQLRRLFVNACYWAVGLEDRIDANSSADTVEWYEPSPSGFGLSLRGLQPVEMRRASRGVHRW